MKFGRAALHLAARSGELVAIKEAIAEAKDIDAADDHGFTPLYHASMFGHTAVMELMLKAGADIAKTDLGGLSPLHIACEKGQAPAVLLLLGHGADIAARDSIGRTPLAWAEAKGHLAVVAAVQRWLEAGSSPPLVPSTPTAGGDGSTSAVDVATKRVGTLCQRCQGLFITESNHRGACWFHPESFSGEDSQRWTAPGERPPEGKSVVSYFYTCCGAVAEDAAGCCVDRHVGYDEELDVMGKRNDVDRPPSR